MNLPAHHVPHPNDIIIPTKLPETSLVVPGILYQQIVALHQRMTEHVDISDDASFQSMRKLVKDASALKKKIEVARQLAKDPYWKTGQAIDMAANAIMNLIEIVVNEGKAQETFFLVEQDRKKAEEAKRVADMEATAKLDTSRPTAPLTIPVHFEVIDAPISKRKVVKITDYTLIPRDYWIVDMKRLEADVLDGAVVPGTVIEFEQQVVAR